MPSCWPITSKKAKNPRKALLVISDGGDNNSRYTEGEIKNLVKEADTQIYAIGIYESVTTRGRTAEELAGPGLLTDIAEQTGGRQYAVENLNELPDIASKIGVELRNQYILGYAPQNREHDGKYRRVQVKLVQPRGLLLSGLSGDWAIMLPLNNRILTTFAAAVAAASALLGQPGKPAPKPPSQDDTGTIFRADTRLVVLPTTVVDKNGHLVTTLPREAFTVLENGVQQEIKQFKREDVPVSMGLIIDNSGSMRDKRAKVEAAALALVKASNPEDEVFIVNFNDEAFLDNPHGKDFTSDVKEMEDALTRIDSRGGTAMRDAIRMSIDHVKEKAHKDKKVLVVVTDGNDNSSVVGLEDLVKAAQQSEVLIYAVGLLTDEERREAKRAEKALEALAEATGGETFFPRDVSEVERIANQVAHDIRNQYTIAYTPLNQAMDGSFRQIKVTVKAAVRVTLPVSGLVTVRS